MCLAVFMNLEGLSQSLFQCKGFFESGNCKRAAVTSPSVGKILEHFRIYGTAIPFYSHGDSQPSV